MFKLKETENKTSANVDSQFGTPAALLHELPSLMVCSHKERIEWILFVFRRLFMSFQQKIHSNAPTACDIEIGNSPQDSFTRENLYTWFDEENLSHLVLVYKINFRYTALRQLCCNGTVCDNLQYV